MRPVQERLKRDSIEPRSIDWQLSRMLKSACVAHEFGIIFLNLKFKCQNLKISNPFLAL